MSSEQDRQNNEQKKKTRRTRKDEEGRNFNCPCGKSYLSYPALYTHIKTKHCGKMPKIESAPQSKQPQVMQPQSCPDLQPQCFLNIKNILQKNFPNNDSTPSPLSQLNSQQMALITQILQRQENGKQAKNEEQHQQLLRNNKDQCIQNIFGKFLNNMKKILQDEQYLYLCHLVINFFELLGERKQDDQSKNNGTFLLHLFNQLIVRKKVPEVKFLYEPQSSPVTVACKILFNLGVWLFEEKYSNYSIKYNVV